ncbi:MAG: hypothetical protein LBQ54_10200 [Planctomycetaceae bacterium]|jgi:hypothetical protein|nr:hypothetical protein [Planctomycetaceae bacterium]
MSEAAMTSESRQVKKSWRPGLLTWLVIGGLILVNLAVFCSDGNPHTLRKILHDFNPCHWPAWYAVNLWLAVAGLTLVPLLMLPKVQRCIHSFLALKSFQFVTTRFKQSRVNQRFVRFMLQRKFRKRLFRGGVALFRQIQVERCPRYVGRILIFTAALVFFLYSDLTATPRMCVFYSRKWIRLFFYWYVYVPFYYGPLVEYMYMGKMTWRLFIAPATGLLFILWLLRLSNKMKKRRNKNDK